MEVDSEKSFVAVKTAHFFPYSAADTGTGRCRLSKKNFQLFGIRVGWILKLLLKIKPDLNVSVLCVAWADTLASVGDMVVCVDDSVYLGEVCAWEECPCDVCC